MTSDLVRLSVTANRQIPTVTMRVDLLDGSGAVLELFPTEAASVLGAEPRTVLVKIGPADSNADVILSDGKLLERVASCRAEVTEMDLHGPTD